MSRKLNFIKQIIAEKSICVLLVRGQNPEGASIYAYVAVRADNLEAFMEAQQAGTLYPEDFGIVVETGEGLPSSEVQEKMQREYGFNHQAMIDIPDSDTAFQIASTLPINFPKNDL
jgi:hypothetical protein